MCIREFHEHEQRYKEALIEQIAEYFDLEGEERAKLTQELRKCISQKSEPPSKGKWNSFTLWREETVKTLAEQSSEQNASMADIANKVRAIWKVLSPEEKTGWQQKARKKNVCK